MAPNRRKIDAWPPTCRFTRIAVAKLLKLQREGDGADGARQIVSDGELDFIFAGSKFDLFRDSNSRLQNLLKHFGSESCGQGL